MAHLRPQYNPQNKPQYGLTVTQSRTTPHNNQIDLLQTLDLLDTPSRGDYAFPTPPTRAMLDELWQQVPEDRG